MTDNRVSTNTEASYTTVGIREDLVDMIWRVSPFKTPFVRAIGKTTAKQSYHEWQTQALRAASNANAAQEGAKFTPVARTPTVRLGNYCQIFTDVASVTGTDQKAIKAGRSNEMDYQMMLAALAIKTDIEMTVLTNQAKSVAAASDAPLLAGVPAWLTSNTSHGSGGSNPTGDGTNTATAGTSRTFNESLLDTVLESVYTNSTEQPSILLVPPAKKAQISAMGGNQTRMADAGDATIYSSIEVYVGQFGELRVTPDIFLPDATAIYAFSPEFWDLAWLRPLQAGDIAKVADSTERFLLGEVTLTARNQAASGVVADLS